MTEAYVLVLSQGMSVDLPPPTLLDLIRSSLSSLILLNVPSNGESIYFLGQEACVPDYTRGPRTVTLTRDGRLQQVKERPTIRTFPLTVVLGPWVGISWLFPKGKIQEETSMKARMMLSLLGRMLLNWKY